MFYTFKAINNCKVDTGKVNCTCMQNSPSFYNLQLPVVKILIELDTKYGH